MVSWRIKLKGIGGSLEWLEGDEVKRSSGKHVQETVLRVRNREV